MRAFALINSYGFISNWEVALRLILSIVMGGLIGIERGFKNRPAGMRTYMLVCLGASIVTITSLYLMHNYGGTDPSRMGAQVISGIGFIGAGTIIITRERQVRGLTTAAGLWASACLGLAIGVGFYLAAFIGMACIIFVTALMHSLDNRLVSRSRSMTLYVELKEASFLRQFITEVKKDGTKVTNMELVRSHVYNEERQITLILSLLMPQRRAHHELVEWLNEFDYISFAEEL